jgi:hypothetical protein
VFPEASSSSNLKLPPYAKSNPKPPTTEYSKNIQQLRGVLILN